MNMQGDSYCNVLSTVCICFALENCKVGSDVNEFTLAQLSVYTRDAVNDRKLINFVGVIVNTRKQIW